MKASTPKAIHIVADKFQDSGFSGIRKLFSRRRCLARSRSTGLRIAPPALHRRVHPSPLIRFFSHLRFCYNLKNKFPIPAFTLAEVLITLAIIGVVAAITIPTLVADYQRKSWDTASYVFQRKLEEALKQMNTQQVLAGYKSTADFVGALGKYFKINKVCQNDDIMSCFEDKVYWGADEEEVDMTTIKNASNFGQDDWDTELIGVQFANGTTGLIAYNPECKENPYTNQFTGTSCLAILYDTDGFKKPNTQQKDLRSINVESLDGKNCAFEINGTCYTAPFYPESISKAECETLKKNLNIKNCYYDNDFWAGGVKKCGGTSKMPTMSQIAEIADYVYNTSGIGAKDNVDYLTLDYGKLSELGFSTLQGYASSLYLWSGEESDEYNAYRRNFASDNTGWYASSRSNNNHMMVCIGD